MEHEILAGEVWVDEHGRAIVVLPDHVHGREREYECRLDGAGATGVSAELSEGRLTIVSPLPHLKLAWRLTCIARPPSHEKGSSHASVSP